MADTVSETELTPKQLIALDALLAGARPAEALRWQPARL
jgi:hypothetical protein